MKNYSWLLVFFLALLAPALNAAHYEVSFTKKDDITERQWEQFLQGTLVAYDKIMGEEKIREFFPKLRAAGRDVVELKKDGEYFGHIFIIEHRLPTETVYRVGMFGLADQKEFPDFVIRMMDSLKKQYQGFDLSCGCPNNAVSLAALITSQGFKKDNSVAEDPAIMMELYGMDTTPANYTWYRLTNK